MMNKTKFFGFFLAILICFGIPLNTLQALDPTETNTTNTPESKNTLVSSSSQEAISPRKALTTESIDLFADPVTENDTTVMFRLAFVNAEILNFVPQDYFALPACENQKYIEDNKLCADFSQSTPFKKGDLLGKMIVKWGDSEGNAAILQDATNGYFNGTDTNYLPGVLAEYSIIKAAPSADAQSGNIFGAIFFFTFGLFLIAGGSYFLLKQKQKMKL